MHPYEVYMQEALELARKAAQLGDVPVGALIVRNDEIIARSFNCREQRSDPTAHAEILALQQAAQYLGDWRLNGCTLFVTLEPCPMCTGAIINARIDRVIFGAFDGEWGAMGSVMDFRHAFPNGDCQVMGGVLHDSCAQLLRDFFSGKRKLF